MTVFGYRGSSFWELSDQRSQAMMFALCSIFGAGRAPLEKVYAQIDGVRKSYGWT